jgi:hypothetical protein
MSVDSDTSDTDEPDRSRPSTLEEYRAPGRCNVRYCDECSEDLPCPSFEKRERVFVFDERPSKERRIFASGKWRNVTLPQWDEYLGEYEAKGKHGAKGKPYTWNPS